MNFITGSDKDHEDILQWFIRAYNKHLTNKLYIADFGLENSYPNTIPYKPLMKAWYYKPRMMLETLEKQICWIDSDIEILSDISDIFELSQGYDIAVTEDWCNRHNQFASGLVVCNNQDFLQEWKLECEKFSTYGDQECLNKIAHKYKVLTLPREYQWLRLAETNTNIKTIHWTGKDGKAIIRKKIREYS